MEKLKKNFTLMSDSELEKIHHYSLKILDEIGINVPNEEILDIFKNNGAKVDFEKNIVKIPPALVKKSLKI